jgi:acetyltransferase-like isoleucine patch superfamily enzyme
VTGPVRAIALGWRGLRFRLWALRLRLGLLRHGVRLSVDAPWAVDFRGAPRLRITTDRKGRGELRLRLGRGARIEPGVHLQIETGAGNELELGERAEIRAGVRIWLTGGAIRLGTGVIIRDQALLKSGGEIVFGDYSRFGYSSIIHCHERVEIGSRVGLADLIFIIDSDHVHDGSDTWMMDQPVNPAPVAIGRNTLVGAHVVITRGAVIGANSVVAAGALVRRGEHPDGWLIGGRPAKPLRALAGDS